MTKEQTARSCDFCPEPARYDGKTKRGPWANMCDSHFEQHGINQEGAFTDLRAKADKDAANTLKPKHKGPGYPEPTTDEPDQDQLEEWVYDSVCEATDGCTVEPDGVCEHGHESWLRHLGLM